MIPPNKEIEFNRKNQFIGSRLNTCFYKFNKLITTRRIEVPKMAENPDNEQIQN